MAERDENTLGIYQSSGELSIFDTKNCDNKLEK